MPKFLRFVMAILFTMVLVSTNAVAEGHNASTPSHAPTTSIAAWQTLDCSGPCAHGSEVCAQLCVAGATDLTTDASTMARWPSISIRAMAPGVLLPGLLPAPILDPPIG